MPRKPAWQRAQTDALLARLSGPLPPFWRDRLRTSETKPGDVKSPDDLHKLPAIGERDVSPNGDAAAMSALVVHSSETGFALHAGGGTLRRALKARMSDRETYRQIVDSEIRATSFGWTGSGFRWPVAYTRGDLDVLARAGARCWTTAGLTPDDILLTTAPAEPTPISLSIQYAALASGAPAMVTAATIDDVRDAAALAPPTVVAITADQTELLRAVPEPSAVRTVLILGPARFEQRQAIRGILPGAAVLAWHVPSGGRLPWTECRSGEQAGFHTHPDLDLVQLIDPVDGRAAEQDGEIVLTQLGMRGTALLRWRTGDLAEAITDEPCPSCGREVPRITGVRGGLVVPDGAGRLDLRTVAAALRGRDDVTGWQLVHRARLRDAQPQVIVHVQPADPELAGETVVAVAAAIRAAGGGLPAQIVAEPHVDGGRTTGKVLLRNSH